MLILYLQAANKYAEKGKELLAKVVFYRKAEDKQKLTMDAWFEWRNKTMITLLYDQ